MMHGLIERQERHKLDTINEFSTPPSTRGLGDLLSQKKTAQVLILSRRHVWWAPRESNSAPTDSGL